MGAEQREDINSGGLEQGKKKKGGVGILLRAELEIYVISVQRVSPRIMSIEMIKGEKTCHIFSVYAPQAGRSADDKTEFWGLQDYSLKIFKKIHDNILLILGGDLNRHIGKD